MDSNDFGKRLAQLRMSKNVSARDMSLSIGQSAGYINNIENGVNYPSMTLFFYICEYLSITPKDFFDYGVDNPTKVAELQAAAQKLSDENLDHLLAIVKGLR